MKSFLKYILFLFLFNTFLILDTNSNEELKKIDKQLKQVEDLYKSGVFDDQSYQNAKDELINRRLEVKKKINTKKNTNPDSKTLEKQLEVIEKLLNESN